MNEQQLQQILTIQQAIAAAATAAVINSLLNPQQQQQQQAATDLAQAAQAALTDNSSNDHQQENHLRNNQGPSDSPPPPSSTGGPDPARIQELLMQLQQQAALGQSPLNLNLASTQPNLAAAANAALATGSPINRFSVQDLNAVAAAAAAATSSNNQQSQQSNQASPIKKLKRHHLNQQPFNTNTSNNNRSSEATSKSQHTTPKNHSTTSSISNLNRNSNSANTTSSSSSSPFIANNVGLPRKLVRGQDVWLGRGAEQTRQILKCMWCGQSFRTLAEMTQHMKITQHYTNIISQEQITSWRQPESSDNSNAKHNNKSTAQVRNFEDNQDDFSDKLIDSDRDDILSNDDDADLQAHRAEWNNKNIDSADNISAKSESIHEGEHSPRTSKGSSSNLKPLTRSRRRENERSPIKREQIATGGQNLPLTSSSSQQNSGSSISNLNSVEMNEDSLDTSKQQDCKTNGDYQVSEDILNEEEDSNESKRDQSRKRKSPEQDERSNDSLEERNTSDNEGDTNQDDDDRAQENEEDEGKSEISEAASNTKTPKLANGQKGETGDPLSALETMVEKSFDPRLRPGVANGGILQRLGIDEEVCPPWQHINYANWYAAACGHPMAAALLLNLQNGIRLSKNVDAKKNDD